MKIGNWKKGFMTIGIITAMLFSMPFVSSALIKIRTANDIYKNIEDIPQKELGLVLGAAAYGDKLSDILRDRVDTAIELYNAKKIETLIMSGAPNETEAMKNYAIENGITENAITEDPAGINTLASVRNIAELEKSIIIVTQEFHLPRALFIADHFGLDAVGIISDKHEYIKILDFKKREILATTKAMIDLFFLSN